MTDVATDRMELDPQSAIEQWCDQKLVAEERRLRERGHNGDTLAAIFGKETPSDRANDPLCWVLDQLRTELHYKLLDGELIGAGYLSGDLPETPRRDVQPNRWSVLRIDFENWSAEGSGIVLNDLRICQRDTDAGAKFQSASGLSGHPTPAGDALPKLQITQSRCQVRVGERTCTVPNRAFRLLVILAQRLFAAEAPFGIRDIHQEFYSNEAPDRAPYELVRRLRQSLDSLSAGEGHRLIRTLHRSGIALGVDRSEVTLD